MRSTRGVAPVLILSCGALCGWLAPSPGGRGVAAADEPAPPPRRWTFQEDAPGAPPAGFQLAATRGIKGARWEVAAEGEARFLQQLDAQPQGDRYAMAVARDVTARDLRLSVKGKPVSGQVDQAVGLVWRWKDQDDYYLVRSNALEKNVRLYRVLRGDRVKFASAEDVAIETGAWHTLAVEMIGTTIKVSLNGKQLLTAEDATFPEAGRVGVWVKADSVTCFDYLELTTLAN